MKQAEEAELMDVQAGHAFADRGMIEALYTQVKRDHVPLHHW